MEVRSERLGAALWAGATALAALAFIYTASLFALGVLLVVPLFVWLLRATSGRAHHGVLIGAAALPGWVAWYHGDYVSCPPSAADIADGAWHCGGTDPRPYLLLAALMLLGFVVVWNLARPGQDTRGPLPGRPTASN